MTGQIKETSMLYKRLNFSVSRIRKLDKSLKHSLRIPSKEIKKLQWDESLSHKNVFIVNGKRVAMNTQDGLSFIKETLKPFYAISRSKEKRQEDIETKGKYKYKIKKIIKEEAGNPVADYLEDLIERNDHIDPLQVAEDFNGFDLSRKAQKLKSVQNYIDLHNGIIQLEKPLDGRKTVIQEAFFKFPIHNQVDLSADFYISGIQEFYSKYFPDYKVLLTVYHGDELEAKGDKKVGDHPHIFIDCKNQRTGEYDLTEHQALLANKVIESIDFFKEYNPVNTKSQTYEESQIIGEALQELFYQHINDKFKNENIPIVASRVETTQESLELRKKLRLESKKAKEDRAFNLYSLREKQLAEATETLERTQQEVKQAVQQKSKLEQTLEKKNTLIVEQTEKLEQIETASKNKINLLSNELNEQKRKLDNIIAQEKITKETVRVLENKKTELEKTITAELEKHNKAIKALNAQIVRDEKRHAQITKAMTILNDELQPLIYSLDVKIDKILNAQRLSEPTDPFYKELKENVFQTARYLGREKRKDYLFNVHEKLNEVGLDSKRVEFGVIDTAKLWASDKFTDKQTIEFDEEEKKQAKKARARRMLKPKPPSPFNNPNDPYQ